MQRSSTVRALMLAATAALAAAVPASAVTTVTTVNGAGWQIHDIAPPKLDTGSIRAISDNAFYGFGGIRVRVSDIGANDPSARLNGELMRGFGLTFDGEDSGDSIGDEWNLQVGQQFHKRLRGDFIFGDFQSSDPRAAYQDTMKVWVMLTASLP